MMEWKKMEMGMKYMEKNENLLGTDVTEGKFLHGKSHAL